MLTGDGVKRNAGLLFEYVGCVATKNVEKLFANKSSMKSSRDDLTFSSIPVLRWSDIERLPLCSLRFDRIDKCADSADLGTEHVAIT